ncbi:class I SAM-dependent methyltransferase [Streptacidiphilus pinicola]|uniref:class I SAM-dependent methyltransferase n=1 Tax=Streptacidiphilus pinicola TaxID=2219663 RepID=UPI001402F134|nr:class I SAM-dependent methyltransferase [Streptacidiphilus pinicola]
MRKALRRAETNERYWDRRWEEAGSDAAAFDSLDIYPVKYAQMVMTDPDSSALELGCGLGRVVKHYHRNGWKITGIERSPVAVDRMREDDPELDVAVGDATDIKLEDGAVDVLMAFGLYHNIENELEQALAESARVIAPGGRFCITMRPDNIEMRLNERYWRWRNRHRSGPMHFHKWLVGRDEFAALLATHGLNVTDVHYARNMSILYRVPWLRDRRIATSAESVRRAGGYRLNRFGRAVDGFLMRRRPQDFCNVFVFIGTKGAP